MYRRACNAKLVEIKVNNSPLSGCRAVGVDVSVLLYTLQTSTLIWSCLIETNPPFLQTSY